jgi:hypothetical protein
VINRAGPAGTRDALMGSRQLPVGFGALVGDEGGSPLGLAADGVRPPDPPGVQLDAVLDGLDRRLSALEAFESGESNGAA